MSRRTALRADAQLADARRAVHLLLDTFEREGVHASVEAVRELAAIADTPADGEAAARERLAAVRERYDLLRSHRDGLDDVYFPRADHGEQVRVNRELDAVRAAILAATEPVATSKRDRRRARRG